MGAKLKYSYDIHIIWYNLINICRYEILTLEHPQVQCCTKPFPEKSNLRNKDISVFNIEELAKWSVWTFRIEFSGKSTVTRWRQHLTYTYINIHILYIHILYIHIYASMTHTDTQSTWLALHTWHVCRHDKYDIDGIYQIHDKHHTCYKQMQIIASNTNTTHMQIGARLPYIRTYT